MGAIGDGIFSTSPDEGQAKARILIDHVAGGSLQFFSRYMLVIDALHGASGHDAARMPCRLGSAQITPITKDRDQVLGNSIGQLGIRSRGRAEVPSVIDPVVHELQDVEQVALWELVFHFFPQVDRL